MKNEDIIRILKNEQECATRAFRGGCDRDCENCELVMEDSDIIGAYDAAIAILKEQTDEWTPSTVDPEKSGEYLVTTLNNGGEVTTAYFKQYGDATGQWNIKTPFVAWRPLPPPWPIPASWRMPYPEVEI